MYSETPLFQMSNVSRKILNPFNSKIIESIYVTLFQNLDTFAENTRFIDTYINNKMFYNREDYEQSIRLFGEFCYDGDKKVKTLLENLNNTISEKISQSEQNCDKYNEEFPSKFIDPIMFNVIEDPLEIPSP